jgi:hypothetical protein
MACRPASTRLAMAISPSRETDHVPTVGCAERVALGPVHEMYGKLSASGDVETCCTPLRVSIAYWIEKGLERTAHRGSVGLVSPRSDFAANARLRRVRAGRKAKAT